MKSAFQELLSIHRSLIEGGNDYAYFELAYTHQTGWMGWLCSAPCETHPNRIILAKGQGSTPEAACQRAVDSYHVGAPSQIQASVPHHGDIFPYPSKHLVFRTLLNLPTRKTHIWQVSSKHDDSVLGLIKWFGRWRRYTFFPASETAFECDCLSDIAQFCKDATQAHKTKKHD
jgi:hypothetical protein